MKGREGTRQGTKYKAKRAKKIEGRRQKKGRYYSVHIMLMYQTSWNRLIYENDN